MTDLEACEPLISFIVTCKGRLEHLMVSLPRLIGQRNSKVILVDSECPDGAGDWAETQFNQITIVRIQDQGQFHVARARNEGLKNASTEWVCFVDADVILSTEVGDRVSRILDQNSFYLFEKVAGKRGTYGSCLARLEHLMKISGYDEAFKGWGGEDEDLYWRLENLGVARKFLSHELIDAVIDHPNEMRTRFSEKKSLKVSQTATALYRLCKISLVKINPQMVVDFSTRRALFQKSIEAVYHACMSKNHKAEMIVETPIDDSISFPLATINQSFRFEIDVRKLKKDTLEIFVLRNSLCPCGSGKKCKDCHWMSSGNIVAVD